MASFERRSQQVGGHMDGKPAVTEQTAGRRTNVPAPGGNVTAQIVRSARGALSRLRVLAPVLAAAARGEAIDDLQVLDARGALRRVDEAIGQLGRIADHDPAAAAARDEIVAERDAIAPRGDSRLGDRKAAAWRAEAAPIASRLGLGSVDVRADDQARSITEAKGARGVALGTTVFLHPDRIEPGTPDGREVLAHELVHVAQSRVAGTEDDQADRDAAELEAADLASAIAGGGATRAPSRHIDLSRPAADADAKRITVKVQVANAANYLHLNQRHLWDGIRNHLATVMWPDPHPRMRWVNRLPFFEQLFNKLKPMVFPFENPSELRQVLHPADPYAFIDDMRPILGTQDTELAKGSSKLPRGGAAGPVGWRPSIGLAIGQLFEASILESMRRLAPRWLAAADAKAVSGAGGLHVEVDPGSIPLSHHMDRALVHAMSADGAWDIASDPAKHGKKPTAAPTLRKVQLEWLGGKKGTEAMWNWVRVTSPLDATAEEVAAQLYAYTAHAYNENNTSFLAYGLTAAPPLFGVPGSWARNIPEAHAHAPKTASPNEDAQHAQHRVLAASPVAEELALHEVANEKRPKGAKPPDQAAATELVEDCTTQATFIAGVLKKWGVAAPIQSTLAFLAGRRATLGDPTAVNKWQPVLEIQRDSLTAIGSAVSAIDRSAATMVGNKRTGPEAAPLREILEVYGDAAGMSHLVDTSRRLITRGAQLQAGLTLRSVQGSSREVSSALDMMHDAGAKDRDIDKAADKLAERQRQMSSRLIAGGTVTTDELESYSFDSGATALRAKINAIRVQLGAMQKAANEAGDGFAATFASLFSGEFRDLAHATGMMRMDLDGIELELDHNYQSLDKQALLQQAQTKFLAMAGNNKIQKFLENAQSLVKWQGIRTAAIKIAVLLGISLVGGFIGGAVARGVGGLFMRAGGANAVSELGLGARMVAGGAGMVTDTAIASAGKVAIYGGSFSHAFLENLIENLGSHAIMKALSKNADELKKAEEEASKFWSTKGGIVLKESAAITGHGIMGAALGYVSTRLVTGKGQPPPETLTEWLMQGASIAVGRHVGKQIHHRLDNIKKLAAIRGLERGEALLRFAIDVHQQAKQLEVHPEPNAALDLLAKRHQVLMREIDALDMVSKRPELMKAAGLRPGDLHVMQRELHGQLAEVHGQGFAAVPLHLAGLRELVPGALWRGTHEQIEHAIRSAEQSGIDIKAKRNQATMSWDITLDGRRMQIHEQTTGLAGKTPRAGSHAMQRHAPQHVEYKPVTLEADHKRGERALTTDFVPGSAFKGNTETHAGLPRERLHAQRLETAAIGALPKLNQLVPGVRDIQIADNGRTAVITLDTPVGGTPAGTHMSVDIQAGPLPGQAVALAIVNPTKQGVTRVGGHDIQIHGRHTIELSVHMDAASVERAVAGQLAGIVAAQRAMHLGKFPRGGAAPDGKPAPLGPTDVGRAGEINLLVRQMVWDPDRAPANRRELAALVEHLGLRKGTPGADERASILDNHLTKEARDALAAARRPHDELDSKAKADLDRIEAAAWKDLEARTKASRPGEVHPLPPSLAPKGKQADHAKVVEAARVAARVREMVSERTLSVYRDRARALKPGEYLSIADLQLGGGAALAARRPGALLVDARGRWQADGSKDIAQTAHQLDKLREAGFGDPREVAGPNERVPIEAVRYWEDTIAAQGEVINGTASFRSAPDGQLLVVIKPTDGSPELVISVKGTPTIATGFPTERAPGATMGTGVAESILMVERQLQQVATDAKAPADVRAAAAKAAQSLAELKSGSIVDGALAHRQIEAALGSLPRDIRPALLMRLRGLDTPRNGPLDGALNTLEATSKWNDLRNGDAKQSVFLGDEANLQHIRDAASREGAPKEWVIAGTGGTAISAAEIILDANPKATVTMLGRDTPAGLRENDQFRAVQARHGARLKIVVKDDMNLGAPTRGQDGRYEAWKSADGKEAYSGDGYIAALGREQQVPPMVTELMMQARRAHGDDAVKYVPKFDKDNQYLGYDIQIRMGTRVQTFEITGGASRFVPRANLRNGIRPSVDPAGLDPTATRKVDRATNMDAPGTSGNFDAGFVATATQAWRYAMDRLAREGKK